MIPLKIINVCFVSICSGFKDLFDWQHFIETLKDEIHIVETLPPAYAGIEPFAKTPISWSKVSTNIYIDRYTHIHVSLLILLSKTQNTLELHM